MTKVQIINGSRLGNILFQYAAGRVLAIRKQEELTLDFSEYINWFDIFGFRAIKELGYFHLETKIYNPLVKKIFKKLIAILDFKNQKNELFLDTISYSEKFNTTNESKTIQGYFQSEKFFNDIKATIKRELHFREFRSPEPGFETIKQLIVNSNSVAIHVRRGDLVKSTDSNLLSASYYSKAIDKIREFVGECKFFVFSDDIHWCKQNPLFAEYTFVDLNCSKQTSIFDLYLMSLCKHQIIANSTFSWWAAWLNENVQKVIIAPSAKGDYPDKYPSDWKLIDL
jgi:hypothetical protein